MGELTSVGIMTLSFTHHVRLIRTEKRQRFVTMRVNLAMITIIFLMR